MGILGETREWVERNEEATRQQIVNDRDAVINATMAEMRDTLEAPEFTGDIETALVHHFGREAFTDSQLTGPYTDLAEEILRQPEDDVTPVVILSKDERGHSTIVTYLQPFSLKFKSTTEHLEGVRMHAFTDERAGVTHKKLALDTAGARFSGNLVTASKPLFKTSFDTSLVLSEQHIADNGRGRSMGEYSFTDSSENLFGEDAKFAILVGWPQIESACLKNLDTEPWAQLAAGQKFKEAFSFGLRQDNMAEQAPRLKALIDAYDKFTTDVGVLANREYF